MVQKVERQPIWLQRELALPEWWPIALIGVGLAVRLPMLRFRSADWNFFLSGWMDTLHDQGLHAFSHSFSDYSFPYLFLLWIAGHLGLGNLLDLKLLSILIDATLAASAGLLARQLWPHVRAIAAAAVVFALPTVTLNGAMWGQCDGLYTSLVLLAVFFVCKGRWTVAGALVGAALAVKLQTAFALPPILVLWWHHDRRVRSIVSAAATFFLLTLPPVLLGRPLMNILGTYRAQANEYPALTSNAPNLYQWWRWSDNAGTIVATALTVVALTALAALGSRRAIRACRPSGSTRARSIAFYCCLSTVLLPFVLPRMHERYFFVAEVLTVILAFGHRGMLFAAGALQIATVVAYMPFLIHDTVAPLPAASVGTLGALAMVTVASWRELADDTDAAGDANATVESHSASTGVSAISSAAAAR